MKKYIIALLSLWVTAPALTQAAEVRVYSGRHYNSDRKVFKQFSDLTGIRVRLLEATGVSLVERLKREGDRANADVIILVDAARIQSAADQGLLQPSATSALVRQVPSEYRDPKGRWFGMTRRIRGIIVNPSRVDIGLIRSYEDLASPELKDKLCLRKRQNVYNQSLVASQIALKGPTKAKQWLNGMLRNVSEPFFASDTALIRAVAQGKCGVGVVNHYYLARMQAGGNGKRDAELTKNVRLILPRPAHVNISAIGIATSAKNYKESIQLAEFLTSKQGSSALASSTYEYPIMGSSSSNKLREYGDFTSDGVSISNLSKQLKPALALMTQVGWK